MSQNYTWPSVSVTATNPSVALNGSSPSAGSSTLVAGQNPSGDQKSLQTDAAGNLLVALDPSVQPLAVNATIVSPLASGRVVVDSSQVTQPVSAASLPLPSGASTSALQTTGNTSLASIDSKLTSPLTVTGPLTDTQLRASPVPVSGSVTVVQPTGTNLHTVVDSSALPTGAATAANQSTANTSLASIDSKLTSPLAVTGPLTDTQLRASAVPISAASLPLPSGAATSANQSTVLTRLSGSLVPAAYDEIALTYTGDNITTAVYKLASVTVKTLTLSYTGDRLDGVVAS